jgi:hypothetical protein
MPDLDQHFTDERLKADSAELQRRHFGQTFHEERIQIEADKAAKIAPGDERFVAPSNLRSDAEIDALLKSAPAATPTPKKVPFGFHEPGVVVGESIGPAAEGAMKVLEDPQNAWLGLGPLGMTKMASGAKGLLRPRFNVEETIERALNPSPLAERVTEAINSKTAVLTDVDAQAKAAALVQSGGVNRDTLVQYAPGTALLSAPHALAAQEVLTQESRTFIDTARHALATNDPQLADQAMAQFSRLLDPAGGFSGAVTTTGQTLRVASSEDIKALNLLLERSSKTATGMTPLEQLAVMMADPATDPAKQGKSLTQAFRNVVSQVKEVVATGDESSARVIMHQLKTALKVPVTPKSAKGMVPPAPAKPATPGPMPARMTEQEKKALQQFFVKNPNSSLSDLEMLKAIVSDPSLQPDALINALNNLKKPGWKDGAQYLLINSMLTPASIFVNFAATATMLPVHIAARGMGAKIGQVSRLLGGKAGVITGESEAMVHGLYASFWDSVKLGGRVARTGNAEIGPMALKEQAIGTHPITADALFENKLFRYAAGIPEAPVYNSASFPILSRAGLTSKAINFFGTATGIPGRLMLTGDQFIQSLAMNAEMHAQVYRQASAQALQDGYTLKEFYQAYAPLWRKLQRDMPEDIRAKGEAFSLEVSLNAPAGPIGKNILSLREKVNEATGIGGTIALPFYNTLANSAKATWEFSPLAPASNALGLVAKTFRSDMFGDDPVKRDLAVGKWAFGTMLMSSLVWAAVNGRLTGRGPDNKELQQQEWEAQGLPDSWVYHTDTGERVQISRLGILSNLAGMSADVAEVWLQADERTRAEMAQLLVTAYVGNLSFDFLQSSAGVTQAIVNGMKRKEDVDILAKSIGAFVPLGGTIRAAEKALAPADNPPLMKDARTSLDKMLARFPGYDSLAKQFGMDPIPVLRNQFGYAIRQPQAAWGTEWFNPLYISAPSQNETLQKMSQIQIDLGVTIQRPSNVIGDGKMPLTAQEYDAYERMAGQQWEQRAEQLLPVLERKDVPDQVKRDLILHHLMEARRTATAQLKGQSHDLVEAMTTDKVQRYTQPTSPKRVTRPPSLRQE